MHFHITINGVDLVYTYIRKNACSSWKRMFVGQSRYAGRKREYSSRLQFMLDNHRIRGKRTIHSVPYRIVCIREPCSRLVSGFLNQIVCRSGTGSRVIDEVSRSIQQEVRTISFRRFVAGYLDQQPVSRMNPHFVPQSTHMKDVDYTHYVPMERLCVAMESIVGEEVARAYFGKPSNVTGSYLGDSDSAMDASVEELHRQWIENGQLPSASALIDDEIYQRISRIYGEDVALWEQFGPTRS